tara:strand:- start:114 stop:239 length:126 start_codon:yes stop_codon:yes gene_type:complete
MEEKEDIQKMKINDFLLDLTKFFLYLLINILKFNPTNLLLM